MITITIPCANCPDDIEFVVDHIEDLETFPWTDRVCGSCLSSELDEMEVQYFHQEDPDGDFAEVIPEL